MDILEYPPRLLRPQRVNDQNVANPMRSTDQWLPMSYRMQMCGGHEARELL